MNSKSLDTHLDKSDMDKFNENSANIAKAVTLISKVLNLAQQIQIDKLKTLCSHIIMI